MYLNGYSVPRQVFDSFIIGLLHTYYYHGIGIYVCIHVKRKHFISLRYSTDVVNRARTPLLHRRCYYRCRCASFDPFVYVLIWIPLRTTFFAGVQEYKQYSYDYDDDSYNGYVCYRSIGSSSSRTVDSLGYNFCFAWIQPHYGSCGGDYVDKVK